MVGTCVDLEAFAPEEDRADLPGPMRSKALRAKFMLEKVALFCGAAVVPGRSAARSAETPVIPRCAPSLWPPRVAPHVPEPCSGSCLP